MKYISYKNSKMKEEQRKENNNKFIKQKLIELKLYFDNMYKEIDKTIHLDEDQRKIILTDEDYLMIIAGAGAGKTTTISAKVNYLIEQLRIKDQEIVVISFTNKAVQELEEKINKDFKHKVKVTTFHKFGYEIIKQNKKNKPQIIKDQTKIIKNYIEENIMKNFNELKKFIQLFSNYFNITEEINIMKDYDKYTKYKNNQKYPTLKSKIEYINNNIDKTIMKKETVNTKEESIIANYLYINDIKYEYKKQYEHKKIYKPDFTIEFNNKKYYIEYFNINKINKFKYKNDILKIRKIHKKNNTALIEIYEEDIIKNLEKQLKNNKIEINKNNVIEKFNQIIKQDQYKSYEKFIEFCIEFIKLYKSTNEKNVNQIPKKNMREKMFFEFIEKLYNYYESYLKKTNQIDFEDMIIKANKIIQTKEDITLKYKYIIIDEYQDISEARFELIKNISQKNKSKIIVVGDDWQCIYNFAASNINLFTQFEKNVEKCEILKIQKTYRNSQELIDIAGKFIQKNPTQIKKQLISTKKIKNPITIITYKKSKKIKKLESIINYIIKKYGEQKNILILGRYTFDKKSIIDNKIIKEIHDNIIYKNNPKLKIKYMTIHNSKGLGFDNVILINAKNSTLGFPSKIKRDPIIKKLVNTQETMKYAEERRLFYVALTRTKNEIFILSPKNNSSEFIREIKKYKNVITKSNI